MGGGWEGTFSSGIRTSPTLFQIPSLLEQSTYTRWLFVKGSLAILALLTDLQLIVLVQVSVEPSSRAFQTSVSLDTSPGFFFSLTSSTRFLYETMRVHFLLLGLFATLEVLALDVAVPWEMMYFYAAYKAEWLSGMDGTARQIATECVRSNRGKDLGSD